MIYYKKHLYLNVSEAAKLAKKVEKMKKTGKSAKSVKKNIRYFLAGIEPYYAITRYFVAGIR
jgi:hypothetical protein